MWPSQGNNERAAVQGNEFDHEQGFADFFFPISFLSSEKIVAIGLLLSQPHYFCNGGNKPGICTLKHKC